MINGFERFLQHKSLCFKTYNLFSISQPPLPSKPTPLTLFILNVHIYTSPEKFYIREYTSGSLRKNWNISFAADMAIRRQLCVGFDSKVSCDLEDKPDVYSLLLQIL